MIKAYLINLDRSPGRLQFMQAQLDALGISAERVPAIDGSAIDLAPYAGSGLTPGQIGCFLSHRAIWQKFVGSEDENVLVLEDDVRLSDALPALLSSTKWIPADAGVVKLDTSGKRIGVRKVTLEAPGGRALSSLRTVHTGTAGYIIMREFAETLIERSNVFGEAVDQFMFGNRAAVLDDGLIWQLVPAIVAQEKRFNSDLQPELQSLVKRSRRADRSPLKRLGRNLLRPFRKLLEAAARPYRTIVDDIRYLRVPFR